MAGRAAESGGVDEPTADAVLLHEQLEVVGTGGPLLDEQLAPGPLHLPRRRASPDSC